MKYIFYIAAVVCMSCGNNDAQPGAAADTTAHANSSDHTSTADSTTIEWVDPVVQELGKAKEGQVMEISWRFRNTGNSPLIISDVRAGCGCTVADKPEEPIPPGGEGVIKAKFDTKGQLYTQHKSVYVRANNSNKNAEGEDVLSFKVEVEK